MVGFKSRAGPLQYLELSENGKKRSKNYYRKNSPIKTLAPASKQSDSEKNAYVQYRKEVIASRCMDSEPAPQPPGRIVKLPAPFPKK